ncbi:MAG: acyl-CoA synthetase [Cellvibrionaceae bacterium]
MENAYLPHSDTPLLNTLADVEAYERECALEVRFPLQTSYQLLAQAAAKYGDDPALRFLLTAEANELPVDVSFKQLFARVTQTANALHALGVAKSDAVSILLGNTPHSHYATWGSQAVGISSPINPLLESRHIVEIMNATKAKVLITMAPLVDDPMHWDKVAAVIAEVPTLEVLMLASIDGYTGAIPVNANRDLPVMSFDAAIEVQPSDKLLNPRDTQGEDIASYFHTGGTTGRPKIAQVSHRNIAVVSQLIEHLVRKNGRLVGMSALPMFHIYGLISAGIAAIYAGRTIIIMTPDGFRNRNVLHNWWHHAARFKVKAFASVPTVLSALLQVPRGDNDLSHLEDVGSGASPLPRQLRREFEKEFKVRVTNGYGMTETTCIMTRQRAEVPGPEGSVGTRFPYTEVRTVELDGNRVVRDCDVNESGVLIARGPHIFKGYLDPDDNAKAWVDGDWFNTGDVAFIDADGFITLTGRAKDLIIRGGHNIDPVIIEEPLLTHPAVAQVVAVGQPDTYAGELPIAYVQLKPEFKGTTDAEQLLAYCREKISERAAVPKRIEFTDDIPLTAVGKIYKPELRNRAITSVLTASMHAQGIDGQVRAYYEQSRGHVAAISLRDSTQRDKAREHLEKYPVVIEFV